MKFTPTHRQQIKLFFLFVITFTINQVNSFAQGAKEFQLTGSIDISNGQEETITIIYTNPEGEKVSITQTTENGKFDFRGEIAQPLWARFNAKISHANGAFFIEPGNVNLQLSNKLPYLKSVSGSKTQDEYSAYRKNFRSDIKRKSDSIYRIINTLAKDKASEDYEVKRRKLYNSISKLDEEKVLDYVRLHPSSYVSIALARGLYNYDPDLEKLEHVYNLLSAQAKATQIGKQLEAYVYKTKHVVVGKMLPNFTLPNRDAKEVSLADFKNKYVLVDFWYSGCPPCIAQFPKLKEIHLKNKDKFEIVGVSHDGAKNRHKWLAVLDRIPTSWTQLLDTDNAICDKFGIEAFPSNFLLDKDGTIVAKNVSEEEIIIFLSNKN